MANRFLGIGEGLFPPAKFAVEQDADYCMQQVKRLMTSISHDVEACRKWLISARERCAHGEWGPLLKKHGIPRSTAWVIMTADEGVPNVQNETNENVDQGKNNDLRNGTPVAMQPPEQPPPPAANGKPPKPVRQPGEDSPGPLDRAKTIIDKEIEEANLRCQIGAAQIVGVKAQVRQTIASVQELWNAPRKKPKPIVEKVCQCGRDITLAQGMRTGKIAAYERSEAARGQFNLVDGQMQYSKHGGDYFLHRIRCPMRKKK